MDGQIERCAHCGTPATEGRYCTNCGAELGTEPTNPRAFPAPTDTAERVYDLPATAYAAPSPPAATSPTYRRATEPVMLGSGHRAPRGPGPGLWVGVAVALVVVLLLGGFLLLRGGDSDGSAGSSSTPAIVPPTHASSTPSSPDSSPTAASSSPTVRVTGPPTNVAGFARASAPRHAPAGLDFAGRRVTYVAANLVDGRNDTCWRVVGDATGTVLTFRLDQPTRLTRVGLVNGYSKIAYSHNRPYDWYKGNRRVLSAEWVFDDGTKVSQSFIADRAMQQQAIKPVTTRVVRLRITSVSPPGKGRAGRDDTAISEVLLLGRTG